eukprot:CAMPEP_0119038012 /NCGR_PEP_ID=MMETSP1177-20130426/6657_1 /TAXON_ID=2985 /ORGANISM="Ochromonas sp, Strain CCMP1899" /LENGTH=218 /DNA_ID=CAMNT_0007000013 /DNA_START=134 /DNA_END=787 /DNA_ORIENTATION=-
MRNLTNDKELSSSDEKLKILGQNVAKESIKYIQLYNGRVQTGSIDSLNLNFESFITRDNVIVETSAVTDSVWQVIKAVTNIKSDKMEIFKLVNSDTRMGEYDDMFDFCQPIAIIDECTSIRRLCFKPVWPTAPREFLCCTTWKELKDGSLIVSSRSVPDDVIAAEEGFVRGSIIVSGYWIQPYNTLKKDDVLYSNCKDAGCKVTLIAHTDLGGDIPAW